MRYALLIHYQQPAASDLSDGRRYLQRQRARCSRFLPEKQFLE